MHDPEKRILTKATAKVQGRKGKPTRELNVDAENLVNKEWSSFKLIDQQSESNAGPTYAVRAEVSGTNNIVLGLNSTVNKTISHNNLSWWIILP